MNSMFFFFFDIEKRIGLKKLSDADLGISGTSKQTHIGLYNEVLKFLGDSIVTTAMFIHNSYCQILDCYFDRIENPDGSFRSPKIRMGANDSDSVVSKIREFASEKPHEDWYLLWSSLENKDLIFWLIDKESKDFKVIQSLVESKARIISDKDSVYASLKEIMVKKINSSSRDLQKEIEIISQIGGISKKFNPFDIEKARKQFAVVGKKGEELINEYLDKARITKKIKSFEWLNKSKESGLPYDFMINLIEDKKQYIDVKSTRFDFGQNIVFSNQEVEFIHNINDDSQYSVYRVFDMTETNGTLKICRNCLSYMTTLNQNIDVFKNKIMENKTSLLRMGLAVSPLDCFSTINDSIKL